MPVDAWSCVSIGADQLSINAGPELMTFRSFFMNSIPDTVSFNAARVILLSAATVMSFAAATLMSFGTATMWSLLFFFLPEINRT